jgi:hypothetical protein
MADYRLRIIDHNESEVKSGYVTARNRKEAYKSFIDSYGSYIDAKTACIEIKRTDK